jgi:hypothetical protein
VGASSLFGRTFLHFQTWKSLLSRKTNSVQLFYHWYPGFTQDVRHLCLTQTRGVVLKLKHVPAFADLKPTQSICIGKIREGS